MKRFLSFFSHLWTNWISLTGTIITTVFGCTLLFGLIIDVTTPLSNRYSSAALYLIAPVLFIIGLILIPIGKLWERRHIKHHPEKDARPIQALFDRVVNDKIARHRLVFFLSATAINIILVGIVSQKGAAFLDSSEFCGTMCHTVMEPEWTSYRASPHAKVKCVSCHIGPGASWAVKAKADGLRQVWAVAVDNYRRPIPSPVTELRPARDTCEQCHWPAKFHGNRLAFYKHYLPDEKNTLEVSALALKVGGETSSTGQYEGIHWHVSPNVQIEYEVLDKKRQEIGKVIWKESGVTKGVYSRKSPQKARTVRTMDCLDCHNRPTHTFDLLPELAVDRAMANGSLSPAIPYIRKIAALALASESVPRADRTSFFEKKMRSLYKSTHPDHMPNDGKLEKAAAALTDLYERNVFPKMNVSWGTHPNHLGHAGGENQQNGCFRCHNDEHKDSKGKTLSQDCELCHSILHYEEPLEDLPESLQALLPQKE